MAMALYEPGMGYYTNPETGIGRAGDFYTSPHLHPAFGWMLARQLEEMWALMGKGRLDVIEQGPGMGYLAKDILDYLADKELYAELNYHLVELNPALAASQKKLLERHGARISWHENLSGLRCEKGVIIANELLDAFPVHVVQLNETRLNGWWQEVFVGLEGGKKFIEVLAPPSTGEIAEYLEEFLPKDEEFPQGYRTEVNLAMKGWVKEVSGIFAQGFVICIDYGYPAWDYYSPERNRGTLLCYHRHQVSEDPYSNAGTQDMTAHVNFSALKKWGGENGLRALGFCPQGTYLISAGMEEIMRGLSQPDILKIKGLLLPGTMGETHKVMVLYKGQGSPELKGFKLRDQLKNL